MELDEAKVAELGKSLGEQLAEKMQKDFQGLEAKIKGQFQEKGEVSADLTKSLNDMEKAIDGLKEKYGKDIADIVTRMNRAETLDTLGFGGQTKRQEFQSQVKENLTRIITNESFGSAIKGSAKFELPFGQGALQEKAVGNMTNANLTGYASRDVRTSVIVSPYRKTRIRQLLNVGPMTAPVLEYPRATTTEGAVGMQVEGQAKSQIDYDWEMVTATPKTIAAWARVSKQMLADIPWLSNYLSTQMTNDWFDKEDQQLLTGDGTGQNILGIMPQATDYVKTPGTGATYFEYIIDAIAQLESNNYTANGAVLHPLDFVKLLVYKSTTGEFNHPGLVYGADNILRLYGTPIIKNNAIGKGHGIVGDWERAELLVREALQFDLSYEDNNNFTTNQVTLRIEGREALAVYHPAAFRDVNFIEISS